MMRRDAFGRPLAAEAEYFVQDTRQIVGNAVLWWRANGAGYTTDLGEAGRYTGAELVRADRAAAEHRAAIGLDGDDDEVSTRESDLAWPVARVLEVATLSVDACNLPPRHNKARRRADPAAPKLDPPRGTKVVFNPDTSMEPLGQPYEVWTDDDARIVAVGAEHDDAVRAARRALADDADGVAGPIEHDAAVVAGRARRP